MVSLWTPVWYAERSRTHTADRGGHHGLAWGQPRHSGLSDPASAANQREIRVQDAGIEFGACFRPVYSGQLVGAVAARRDHQWAQDTASDRGESDPHTVQLLSVVYRHGQWSTAEAVQEYGQDAGLDAKEQDCGGAFEYFGTGGECAFYAADGDDNAIVGTCFVVGK